MLRALVLLFLLLNAALFFWIRSDPPALRPDREPQRLERQVAPDAIRVLPDLPTPSGPGGTTTSDFGGTPASAPTSAASATSGSADGAASGAGAATLARKTSDTDVDCAESGPLDDGQIAALRKTLAKAGIPPDAIAERRQPAPGAWLVYIGRFSDSQAWQQKADELRRLDVKFDRVTQPASLSPGLSLGSFASAPEAQASLQDFARRGVKTARVVAGAASGVVRRLQVRSSSVGWRLAAGTPHFGACTIEPALPA